MDGQCASPNHMPNFNGSKMLKNLSCPSIAVDSPTGYILEVDLEYPQRLHDAHADLPFCLTRAKPPGNRQDTLLATVYDKVKLTNSLGLNFAFARVVVYLLFVVLSLRCAIKTFNNNNNNNKQRYVIHYRNLQQCMRHGLRKYINMIQRVQHKFPRFATRTLWCPMDRVDHDYGPILASLNIATIEDRRLSADMLFLFKVLNGHFDCPDLVAFVSFIAPQRRMRPRPLFDSRSPLYSHYSVDP